MVAVSCPFDDCAMQTPSVDGPGLTLCRSCHRPLVGSTIGPPPGFRLTGLAGSGYYAHVFQAVNLRSDSVCAAKVYRPGAARRRAAAREARALGDLAHPRIPALIASFVEDGWCFVVMDLIGGPSLRTEVETRGPIGLESALRLGVEISDALEHVASRGWVFRDLHPRNVHLDPTRGAVLLDFDGARRIGSRGSVGGRIGYRAPEVEDRRGLTPAVDVYGLAGCLSFALTGDDPPAIPGVLPVQADADGEIPELMRALATCRARDPSRRSTIGALRSVLMRQIHSPGRAENDAHIP